MEKETVQPLRESGAAFEEVDTGPTSLLTAWIQADRFSLTSTLELLRVLLALLLCRKRPREGLRTDEAQLAERAVPVTGILP